MEEKLEQRLPKEGRGGGQSDWEGTGMGMYTGMYTFVKTHQTVFLRFVFFTVCKLYFIIKKLLNSS